MPTIPIKWNDLAEDIRTQKCVLILGEGAYLDASGQPLRTALDAEIKRENDGDILRHYANDLFLFDTDGNKRSVVKTMRRFYAAQEPPAVLARLAQIPFHVVLTVTPDLLLAKSFENQGFTFQSDFFQRVQKPSGIADISPDNPLLYNVLGCVDDHESLVLTHGDLFTYFESVFAQNGLPQALRAALLNAENLLFLGVPFDRWYLQVLLRVLNIRRDFTRIQSFAAQQQMNSDAMTLCEKEFRINFVEHDIPGFVKKLTETWETQRFPFRQRATNLTTGQLEKASLWLTEGQLEASAKLLVDFLKDVHPEHYKQAVLLSSRCNRLKMKVDAGIIDNRDEKLEFNQITHAMIDLVEDAKLALA
ncbi:MAG: SIR2 family protein [Lewinellaceae bacterium]|nr:SIR2 family protein [Lewinellaceae bacterium]